MVDKQWVNPNLPRKLYEELDNIAKSEKGQKQGFISGKDIIVVLIREYLKNNANIEEGKISVIDTYDKRIILNDSEKGAILVQIDENFKLQCYDCKEDPHDNKYVRYCLKNKDLWHFLKNNKVKLVKPRTTDKDNVNKS